VTSPSGIEGSIGAGEAVGIPADTPLEARNRGDEPASAIVFGLSSSHQAVFTLQVSVGVSSPAASPTRTAEVAESGAGAALPTMTPTPRVVTQETPEGSALVPLPTPTTVSGGAVESPVVDQTIDLDFAYSDWVSGWRQDSSAFYGRPWTVVYGAFSQFPEAALSFSLAAAPVGEALLEVTGLDDEWDGNCEIEIVVNGTRIYEGPSPWLSYEGSARDFSDAPWTTAELVIPAGLLAAGSNEITIANLEPSASFGAPPYILLSDTTLRTGT
jgi:hypothetical protein